MGGVGIGLPGTEAEGFVDDAHGFVGEAAFAGPGAFPLALEKGAEWLGVHGVALEAVIGAEQRDEVPRTGSESLFHEASVEAEGAVEELGDEELVDEDKEFAGFGLGDLLGEPLSVHDLGLNAFVLAAPILVAALFPEVEVLLVEAGMALAGKPADDGFIGVVGFEARVEFVANLFGQSGDFAAAFTSDSLFRSGDRWDRGESRGRSFGGRFRFDVLEFGRG